jgi:hypothetical protein
MAGGQQITQNSRRWKTHWLNFAFSFDIFCYLQNRFTLNIKIILNQDYNSGLRGDKEE